MYIIAVLNQKGGCGKTTTTINLAGALAEAGRNVLLIDLDPQMSLTIFVFGFAPATMIPTENTAVGIFDGTPCRMLAQETSNERVAIVPGSASLAAYNEPWSPGEVPAIGDRIATLLADADPAVDLVLIDCAPSLATLAWSAVFAADAVLVPVVPEAINVAAMVPIVGFLNRVQQDGGSGLDLVGYVLSRIKPKSPVHREYSQQLRDFDRDGVFSASIPELAAFVHAAEARLPITLYDPQSTAAAAINAVTSELLERIAGTWSARKEEVARG